MYLYILYIQNKNQKISDSHEPKINKKCQRTFGTHLLNQRNENQANIYSKKHIQSKIQNINPKFKIFNKFEALNKKQIIKAKSKNILQKPLNNKLIYEQKEKNNPQFVVEYSSEIFQYLKEQEVSLYI